MIYLYEDLLEPPLSLIVTNPTPADPSMQMIPTLGLTVCKYYLHWAT